MAMTIPETVASVFIGIDGQTLQIRLESTASLVRSERKGSRQRAEKALGAGAEPKKTAPLHKALDKDGALEVIIDGS